MKFKRTQQRAQMTVLAIKSLLDLRVKRTLGDHAHYDFYPESWRGNRKIMGPHVTIHVPLRKWERLYGKAEVLKTLAHDFDRYYGNVDRIYRAPGSVRMAWKQYQWTWVEIVVVFKEKK